ncbi:MAG: hypothetical protein ABUT20_32220 [Bacteroidota bacterium]
MKPKKISTFFVLLFLTSLTALAQKIRVKEGNRDVLKNENSINLEFTFDNLSVGKYDKEQDYIKAKTDEYNKKEPGRGDTWAKRWKDDQGSRFPSDFVDLFTKNSKMTTDKNAKYTLIFHTTSIEPGFNIGITRKNAYIDGEVLIVETADKSKVVTKLSLDNAPGKVFMGNDYDTGERISEAFAKAGKELGKYLK